MNRSTRQVVWVEQGIVYPSVRVAASQFGVSDTAAYRAANYQTELREGVTLRYLDGATRQTAGRSVVVLETGRRFPSVAAAAHEFGLGNSQLWKLISRGEPIREGVTLRFEDEVQQSAPTAVEPAPGATVEPVEVEQQQLPLAIAPAAPSYPLRLLIGSDGRVLVVDERLAPIPERVTRSIVTGRRDEHGRAWRLVVIDQVLDAPQQQLLKADAALLRPLEAVAS